MIRDETYAFLCSLRLAREEIQLCKERTQELEDAVRRITAAWKEAPGGSGDVHKDSTVIALADQRAKLLQREKEYAQQMLKVEAFIDRLENPDHRAILRLRYVRQLPWSRVVEGLHQYGLYYTDRHVTRLHGKALLEARKLWIVEHRDGEGGQA